MKLLLSLLIITLVIASPPEPLRNKLLVVHSTDVSDSDYSSLKQMLKGYVVDFFDTDDEIDFRTLGKLNYDFILFAASDASQPTANLEWEEVPELIEDGATVMFALSEDVDDELETILMEIGFSVPGEDLETKEHEVSGIPARFVLTKRSQNRLIVFDDESLLRNDKFNFDQIKRIFDFALHERHHFRVSPVVEISPDLPSYKIKEDVEVCVLVEEWDGGSASYKQAVDDDVYIVFRLVEEYMRVAVKFDIARSKHCAQLRLPEKYGVFTLIVEHVDHFDGVALSTSYSKEMPIRPLRHNEFERWILPAYPFYAVVLVEVVVFLIFSIFFLVYRSPIKSD
ncbi:hypothetical protein RCL1_006906 [Eukaryota sp. TZLM3-RCL]